MLRSLALARPVRWLMGGFVLAASMGQQCNLPSGLPIPVGDPMVTVEVINRTDWPVDPFLYVDPDENVSFGALISADNLVLIDPLLQPGEVVTLGWECVDIGTVISDQALLILSETEGVESTTSPLLRWGEDFLCGDVISFIYEDQPDGTFSTRVELATP